MNISLIEAAFGIAIFLVLAVHGHVLHARARSDSPTEHVSPLWRTACLSLAAASVLWSAAGSLESGIVTPPAADPVADLAAAMERAEQPEAKPGDVNVLIARLAQRLEAAPDDADGWNMLGWSYFNTGRYDKAAASFDKAAMLVPDNPDFASSRAEAMVQAGGGLVSAEARRIFEAVLAKDATEQRARYYLALAEEQAGNLEHSLGRWTSLVADAPADAGWLADARTHVSRLARQMGRDAPEMPATQPVADTSGGDSANAETRQLVIRKMVDGLAVRLETSPHDAEGWQKLIRSHMVLNEPDMARDALRKALAEFAPDSDTGHRLLANARELGVSEP